MGWFKPKPVELEYGQPVHVLVARAYEEGGLYDNGSFLSDTHYHFIGPHGIEYRGKLHCYTKAPKHIAKLCENVQQDFNERIAAMDKAREFAMTKMAVPPLFSPVNTRD